MTTVSQSASFGTKNNLHPAFPSGKTGTTCPYTQHSTEPRLSFSFHTAKAKAKGCYNKKYYVYQWFK